MFNRYILESDTLQSLNNKREVVKKISRKMILESRLSRISKLFFVSALTILLVYSIHHYIVYGHLFHLSVTVTH
jgi:cell division protein FtsL